MDVERKSGGYFWPTTADERYHLVFVFVDDNLADGNCDVAEERGGGRTNSTGSRSSDSYNLGLGTRERAASRARIRDITS